MNEQTKTIIDFGKYLDKNKFKICDQNGIPLADGDIEHLAKQSQLGPEKAA